MVRLKDIAACAGVSIMTVSKVMRDAPDISQNTKARIRLLAQQMGYVPDSMAQSLRSRTTRLFGVLIPTIANPTFARTLSALETSAFECGYEIVLAHSLSSAAREEECIRRLLSRRVDGLFACPVYRLDPSPGIYEELRKRKIPTVLLGHRAPFCHDFSNVEVDDLGGGYLAAKHLLQLGHTRIAFFSGPAASPAAADRFEGYKRALREARIEPDDNLIFAAGQTIEEGAAAALQMLNEKVEATAIQAVNDLVAIGVGNTLLNQGVRIPQDLSLAGFGNILTTEYFRVPLTTVRQPKYRLGIAAFDLMKKLLTGMTTETRRLETEMVIRASTAPPKSHRK